MQNAAKTNYMSVVFEENSFHLTRKKQDSLHIVALTKVLGLWSLRLNFAVHTTYILKFSGALPPKIVCLFSN